MEIGKVHPFELVRNIFTLCPRLAPSGRVITNPIAASVPVSLGYRSTSMALGKNRRGFVAVSPRGVSTFYRRIRDHFNCVQMPINGLSICGVLYRSTQQTNGLSRGRKCLSLGRRDDFTVYERFSSSFFLSSCPGTLMRVNKVKIQDRIYTVPLIYLS